MSKVVHCGAAARRTLGPSPGSSRSRRCRWCRPAAIYNTLKGQLDPEQHGGRTTAGVFVRVVQRLLALTAAIWHNDTLDSPSSARYSPTTTEGLESII